MGGVAFTLLGRSDDGGALTPIESSGIEKSGRAGRRKGLVEQWWDSPAGLVTGSNAGGEGTAGDGDAGPRIVDSGLSVVV